MANESTSRVFMVALGLCLVCSLLVSAAAVGLRPIQERNKALELKMNILTAAGLADAPGSVDERYALVEPKVVNLETGQYASDVDPASFSQVEAAKDPATSVKLPADEDIAGLGSRSKLASVYLVHQDGQLLRVVLPVHGKGLWSTMRGFIALGPNLNTVEYFGFYEHGETPGLGGEVDNPAWKKLWIDKRVYGPEGKPRIDVVKGHVSPADPDAAYKVDGLAGATLTARGVANLVRYWVGQGGFGPYIERLRKEETNG